MKCPLCNEPVLKSPNMPAWRALSNELKSWASVIMQTKNAMSCGHLWLSKLLAGPSGASAPEPLHTASASQAWRTSPPFWRPVVCEAWALRVFNIVDGGEQLLTCGSQEPQDSTCMFLQVSVGVWDGVPCGSSQDHSSWDSEQHQLPNSCFSLLPLDVLLIFCFLQIFSFSYISPYLAYWGLKVATKARRFGGQRPALGECAAYLTLKICVI